MSRKLDEVVLAGKVEAATEIGPGAVARLAHRMGISRRYGGRPSLVDAEGEPYPGRTRADIALGRYPVSRQISPPYTRRSPGMASAPTDTWSPVPVRHAA